MGRKTGGIFNLICSAPFSEGLPAELNWDFARQAEHESVRHMINSTTQAQLESTYFFRASKPIGWRLACSNENCV